MNAPRGSRRLLAVIALVLLASTLYAQDAVPLPATVRDPNTVALLGRAVASLGGPAANSQTNGIIAHGTLTASAGGISGPIVWENAGTEFRYERPGPKGPIVFLSGHGNPAIADGGRVRRNIGHLAMTNLPPHLIAQTLASHLANSTIQISAVQQVALDGTPALKISTIDATDELSAIICKQTWYLDASTLLPLRVDFLASEARNALDTAKMTYIFSNWHNVSGVLMPFQVATLFEGQQVFTLSFDSIQIGVSIPATDFDVPPTTAGGAL
jgi:hypothetical protein